jgi:alpha-L-arabinofuranosidase
MIERGITRRRFLGGTGVTLDTFNRHADKVAMSSIAQLVNNLQSLFLADGDRFVATPNFYVFERYEPHQGATAVRTRIEAPAIAFQSADGRREVFGLAASGSTFTIELPAKSVTRRDVALG